MTLPHKRSRTITVGGDKYRWVLHHRPCWDIGGWQDELNLTIEKVRAPRRRICANFPGATFGVWEADNTIREFLPSCIVTPVVVRQVIEHATEAGWKPETAAENFVMSDADHAALRAC